MEEKEITVDSAEELVELIDELDDQTILRIDIGDEEDEDE